MARSSNPIRFGLNTRGYSYQEILAVAQAGEAGGYDLISLTDQPPEDEMEGWTLATVVGVQTQKIRVTHGTLNVPFRNPALLAKMAASLDNVTGGRVVLTLGAGGQRSHYVSFGVPFGSPGERFTDLKDAVAIMRGMWANETFTYQGERFHVEDAKLQPKPVNGIIPIVIGAGLPLNLRFTGAVADGWLKNGGLPESPEEYLGLLGKMEEGAAQAGRDPTTIRRHLNATAYIGDEDPATVMERIGPMGRTGGLMGTADQILEAIEQYVELGADTFRLRFLRDRAAEQIQQFSEEVIAKLRN